MDGKFVDGWVDDKMDGWYVDRKWMDGIWTDGLDDWTWSYFAKERKIEIHD